MLIFYSLTTDHAALRDGMGQRTGGYRKRRAIKARGGGGRGGGGTAENDQSTRRGGVWARGGCTFHFYATLSISCSCELCYYTRIRENYNLFNPCVLSQSSNVCLIAAGDSIRSRQREPLEPCKARVAARAELYSREGWLLYSLDEGVIVRERVHVSPGAVEPLLRHRAVDRNRPRIVLRPFLRPPGPAASTALVPFWMSVRVILLVDNRPRGEGGGCTQFVHGRNRITIDPRITTMPGRSTSGYHRTGKDCLNQSRSRGVRPVA